ncbi:uncharacterized protein BT62DRAFT_375250 [Guyanagaster necrorhizus]|uniref:Uncharacterized protein n=1 Tax=Guyanagaster necrorhizus TaxID=856835 RepID=A0A9P7VMD8_9AGAR|nr:uncharacterized protein BT62DRAFT_375250 [Guyanagaster necrorhizus MCA 3950]KAG7442559.1 hypothetical protein BT62DRAFT_375250 [Guyanagaster necrorhizus MCA 3950]
MSAVGDDPEAQDALFSVPDSEAKSSVPAELERATFRLGFPPSYVIVGVYRLFTDKALYQPVWAKCKHGTQRGVIASLIWSALTFGIQRKFVRYFMANSPRVTGLSGDTLFGYQIPFSLYTYATAVLMVSQVTFIIRFFLSRNMHIARDRAWEQTVASRGKGPDFWRPYVEEWTNPPVVKKTSFIQRRLNGGLGAMVVKLMLLPFDLVPPVGIVIAAWFKGLRTARILHRRYFEAKKMTPEEIAIFMEERKWDYRIFGFTAAILEGLPIIGLVFTISNRVGAAMWAHDLEKRQHFYASKKET